MTIAAQSHQLKQLQAFSGMVFFVFLAIHLLNTYVAILGPAAYDAMQGVMRMFYQFPAIEALVLAALAVHLIVGFLRIILEPKRTLTSRAKWHRYAGFFLSFVIVGHVLAVRGSSWFYDVYPQFAGLAFSIDYVPGYFLPYYFLLGMAGFYHAINGLGIAAGRLKLDFGGLQLKQLKFATAGSALLMVLTLASFAGVWTDVSDVHNSEFAKLAFSILQQVQN